jgi:menaquinone-dependent protoporphyrinogen oxidase
MKTIMVFSPICGCTKKISEHMKELLGGDVTLVNLKKQPNPPLEKYERVIIGGLVDSGKIQESIKEFCISNQAELMGKELGLFICCKEQGEAAHRQLVHAYPDALLSAARATAYFGGINDFKKMNFLERMINRKSIHVEHKSSKVDFEAVRKFSHRMDRLFNPFLFLT